VAGMHLSCSWQEPNHSISIEALTHQ
jgi:hypothetical protein